MLSHEVSSWSLRVTMNLGRQRCRGRILVLAAADRTHVRNLPKNFGHGQPRRRDPCSDWREKRDAPAKHSHCVGRAELFLHIGSGVRVGASQLWHDVTSQQLFLAE